MNNATIIILSVIIGVALGGFGGFTAGKKAGDVGTTDAKVHELIEMMSSEGKSMMAMGKMMQEGGSLLEERGIKYSDQEMVIKGKDLKAVGIKSEKDGETMVGHEKGMMGEMEGMGH
jgi:uncharacterized membrane protein